MFLKINGISWCSHSCPTATHPHFRDRIFFVVWSSAACNFLVGKMSWDFNMGIYFNWYRLKIRKGDFICHELLKIGRKSMHRSQYLNLSTKFVFTRFRKLHIYDENLSNMYVHGAYLIIPKSNLRQYMIQRKILEFSLQSSHHQHLC